MRVNSAGECVFCQEYTRVQADRRTCVANVCSGRQILERDGTCRECLEYTRPGDAGRNCVSDTCDANSRVNRFGACEVCPAGYTLSADKRFCDLIDAPPPPPPPPPPVVVVPQPVYQPVATGRYKDVAMVSISPLDRLLN